MEAKSKKARTLMHIGVVLGTVAAAAIVAACSSEETKEEGKKDGIGYTQLDPVGGSQEAQNPVDAVPSPDGTAVYFIAFSTQPGPDAIGTVRVPAIFKAVPGAAPQKLHEGEPLNSPFNITISDDGQRLFIADSSADENTSDDGADRSDGRVFSMGVGGGRPSVLAGTENIAPAGVEAMGDSLFITGRKDGQPGVFKTGIGGGAVTVVKMGAPFTDPGGIAVAKDGTMYVVDTGSPMANQSLASVIRVRGDGSAEVIADGFQVGHPAGIALTKDESAVLVSALDGAEGTDRVYRLNLGDRSLSELKGPIGEFYESAGLHRARGADVFAWADSHANGTGTVYVLKP